VPILGQVEGCLVLGHDLGLDGVDPRVAVDDDVVGHAITVDLEVEAREPGLVTDGIVQVTVGIELGQELGIRAHDNSLNHASVSEPAAFFRR